MEIYKNNKNLEAEFNKPVDVDTTNSYFYSGTELNNDAKEITSNLSDTEFGYNLIKDTQNYIEKTKVSPVRYKKVPEIGADGYNCNSFTNSLIKQSGGNPDDIDKKFNTRKKPTPGIDTTIPDYYFNQK